MAGGAEDAWGLLSVDGLLARPFPFRLIGDEGGDDVGDGVGSGAADFSDSLSSG